MRPDQIEALETGDRGRWPEQAFAIAQLRRLAEALKLDPEPLVADLRELLSQQPRDQPSLAASAVMRAGELRGNSQMPREEGRRDWISATAPQAKPWLKPLALMALLGIGGIGAPLVLLRSQPKPADLPSAAPRKQSLLGAGLHGDRKGEFACFDLKLFQVYFHLGIGLRGDELSKGLEIFFFSRHTWEAERCAVSKKDFCEVSGDHRLETRPDDRLRSVFA